MYRVGSFNVRVVKQGERYGHQDILTHLPDPNSACRETREAEPMVEFYDATQDPEKFGPRGQFVARYYLSTLTDGPLPNGLNLYGGCPSWVLTAAEVREALAYAAGIVEVR